MNDEWCDYYPNAETLFLPEGTFDHTPAPIRYFRNQNQGKKPFRFFKMWENAPEFINIVQKSWVIDIKG